MKAGHISKIVYILILIPSIITSIAIANRNENIGSDTLNYISYYYNLTYGYESRISDFLFSTLANFSIYLQLGYQFFFFSIALISLSSYVLLIKKFIKEKTHGNISKELFLISFTLSILYLSPFFWNQQINVLRSALSIPFILIAGLYFAKKRYNLYFIFSTISTLFHAPSIVFTLVILLTKVNLSRLIYLYIALSIMYINGISEHIFEYIKSIEIEEFAYYEKYGNTEGKSYQAGVRLDFLLFTTLFIITHFIFKKIKIPVDDKITKLYIALSVPFLLIGHIIYSDRLLLAAWSLIPLLIGIPISSKIKTSPKVAVASFIIFLSIASISTYMNIFKNTI